MWVQTWRHMKENRNQKRNQKADFFSLVNPDSNRLSGFDFYQLNEYASIIDWTTRVLAILPVLFIYSQNQTATMKVPWIILILAFPILGVALYFLVGLNGGTKKMKRPTIKLTKSCSSIWGKASKILTAEEFPSIFTNIRDIPFMKIQR